MCAGFSSTWLSPAARLIRAAVLLGACPVLACGRLGYATRGTDGGMDAAVAAVDGGPSVDARLTDALSVDTRPREVPDAAGGDARGTDARVGDAARLEPDAGNDAASTCGDRRVEGLEECDDGRDGDDEDGCTDLCKFTCTADHECFDADACNGDEVCAIASHTCFAGVPLVCMDASACTEDTCEAAMGCRFKLIDMDVDGFAPDAILGCGSDCRDDEPAVHPGAAELCNGIDEDCDTRIDEELACVPGAMRPCEVCAYPGIESCHPTCAWSCGGFVIDRVYQELGPPLFVNGCGTDCGDASGDRCALEPDTMPAGCDIAFGPGIVLPPGRYDVVFVWGDRGVFDLSVETGGTILAATTYSNVDMTEPHFPTITLPVVIGAGCPNVSTRMHARPGSRVRLYSIQVQRTGD